MTGIGIWADLFAQRFHAAVARHGLNRERKAFDLSHFVRPSPLPKASPQGRLFD